MKKISILLTILALAIGISSCQVSDVDDVGNLQYEIVDGMAKVVLTAVPETRTYMASEGDVVWSDCDDIAVFAGGHLYDFNLVSGAGTANATFEGYVKPADLTEGIQAAAYPYSSDLTYDATVGVQGLSIDPHQYFYIDGSFDDFMLPMVGAVSGNEVTFTAVGAVLKVVLDDPALATVDSLKLVYNTDEEIILDCHYKTATVTAEGLDFYFVVPAGAQEFALYNYVATNDSWTLIGNYTASAAVAAGSRYVLSPATAPESFAWVKVTSAPADWSGEYLLVYEHESTAYCWTGVDAASCYAEATISDGGVIEKPDGAVSITIASMTDGYSIMVNGGDNNGKYIYGTSGSNTLKFHTSAKLNTIGFSEGTTKITSSTSVMRFNSASDDMRFRYYKAETYSNQKDVQLYRYESVAPSGPKYTVTCTPCEGGTITANPTSAVAGAEITLTAVPSTGYEFNGEWTVEDSSHSPIAVSEGQFTMPESDVTVSATFSAKPVYVYEGEGTAESPYTIADIYNFLDELGDNTPSETEVCVTGTIYKIDEFSTQYKNMTYWIGSEDHPFEVFRGKGIDNADFTSENDLRVGDSVVVCGIVKKYVGASTVYEFNSGNHLVSRILAPYLNATATKTSGISADGETITISVNTNVAEWSASTTDVTNFALSNKTANSIQVVVPANSDTENGRSATITITASGVDDVVIDLTQVASAVTITAGTNGTACTVNGIAGIKIGTSKVGGDASITVPAGTTKLTLYAAAWKDVTGLSLDITGATTDQSSISLNADSGISNNSPFTLAGSPEDFKYVINLSGIEAATTVTFTTSSAKRCVLWGATATVH